MNQTRASIFKNVNSDRDFRASTGLGKVEFLSLCEKFSAYYQPTILAGFPVGFGHNSFFLDPAEALFFLLYYHKVAVSFDVLALSFGMSRATAHNLISFFKKILKAVLAQEKVLPKRLFHSADELNAFFEGVEAILIDATEIPTQRPGNQDEQKARYSKKNISIALKTR